MIDKTEEMALVGGFLVTCERMSDSNDPARGEWVDCWISKGRHSASLALAEDMGFIEVDGGQDIALDDETLEAAREFAEECGYE